MAYNNAADVTLPGAAGDPLPFLMYPQAQSGAKRYDAFDPDNFKYTITARNQSDLMRGVADGHWRRPESDRF